MAIKFAQKQKISQNVLYEITAGTLTQCSSVDLGFYTEINTGM